MNTARKWAEEMDFEATRKGWAHRKRLFVDYPQGVYGFAMNLEKPVFQDQDFRKAIQLDPSYGPAYYGRGWLRGTSGDHLGELEDAQRGLELDPDHQEAGFVLDHLVRQKK